MGMRVCKACRPCMWQRETGRVRAVCLLACCIGREAWSPFLHSPLVITRRVSAPPFPQLIFSRDGYASLLEAHVTNRAGYHRAMQLQEQSRQADKGTTNGGSGTAIGSDDDETVDSESAGGPQDTNSAANRGAGGDHVAATAAVASASPASEGTGSNSAEDVGVSKDNGPAGPIQAPDGSWRWEWSQPPSADLLTPRRPTGIFNTGNSCYAASAIQALLATPALGEWLRSRSHCTCCPAPDDKEDAPAVSKGAVSRYVRALPLNTRGGRSVRVCECARVALSAFRRTILLCCITWVQVIRDDGRAQPRLSRHCDSACVVSKCFHTYLAG